MVRISQRKREKSYSDQTQKASKRTVKRNLKQFQQVSDSYSNMGNRGEDKEQHSDAEATGKGESVVTKEAHNPARPAGPSAMKGLLP